MERAVEVGVRPAHVASGCRGVPGTNNPPPLPPIALLRPDGTTNAAPGAAAAAAADVSRAEHRSSRDRAVAADVVAGSTRGRRGPTIVEKWSFAGFNERPSRVE